MALLDRWPSERRSFRDPVTGVGIEQLTACAANHWLLSAPDTPLTPSGEFLLFLSDRATGPHRELFRLHLRTGTIEQVTDTGRLDPSAVTPAANGRQAIASLCGDESEVAAIDLETGEWETLAVFLGAELEGCHRSASGEYVVTIVNQAEEATITAVHTEGMRTVPILARQPGITAARFSPDSRNSVLYLTSTPPAIRCVEFDGTGDRELVSGDEVFGRSVVQGRFTRTPDRLIGCSPTWLGSGEEVVFIAGAEEGPIRAAPRREGGLREITPLLCRWVRSDRAGERLVALAAPADAADSGGESHAIVVINPRSGEWRPLCSRRGPEVQPCFSPDGESVLYADRDELGCTQIYRAIPESAH